MTKEVVIRLRDDLDGKLGHTVTTREFTIDGQAYESELSDANYNKLLKAAQPFIDVARKAKRKTRKQAKLPEKASSAKKPGRSGGQAEIRQWARSNNVEVAPKGSIASHVVDAWRAANS